MIYALEPEGPRACVLDALAAREAIHISISPAGDGGMPSDMEVYAAESGHAIRLLAVGEWGATELNKSYWLDECTLPPPTYFIECQEHWYAEWADIDWCVDWLYLGCSPIAEPVCP